MKQLKELLLPTLLDRMFVHHRLPPPPSSAFHQVLLLTNLYPIPLGEWRERETERLPCPRTRGSIPFFRNKFQRLFPRIFQDSDWFFSGLQISCEHSDYLATIFSQIIWMGRIMISMITMTIKSKLLTSTQSKEEASLNSCCIYEMLQKNHKNQEWFPRGTKTVKLISYLNKILFQTTTHKLGADPEIFHEGGGGRPKIPINLMRLIKFPQTLPQELPLDLLTWQK